MNFRVARILPLLLLLFLGGGCATSALWDETKYWDAARRPADDPHLRLFDGERQRDVLVAYDEFSERWKTTRPRAYWLYRNRDRMEHERRPRFVGLNASRGLAPLPVYLGTNTPPAESAPDIYAVAGEHDRSFTLHTRGTATSCPLPVYDDGLGQAGRIALTPLAVTADAVCIAAWVYAEACCH